MGAGIVMLKNMEMELMEEWDSNRLQYVVDVP